MQKANSYGKIESIGEKLMSTHCALGVKLEDGSILGCYVHYDGYKEHMLPAIKAFVKDNTTTALHMLICKASERGGIRSFYSLDEMCSTGDQRLTELLDDADDPYIITKENWSEDHGGTHAWYLVDYLTGKIDMKHTESGV